MNPHHKFSADQLGAILRFKGYGNPNGTYWFIGIEEAGDGTAHDLTVRAGFQPVEDLARVHEPGLLNFDLNTLIPTWSTMSRFVLRMKHDPSWSQRESVRRYQSASLGREGGETFLTELLPLPAPSASAWPYDWLYPRRAEYEEAICRDRVEMLRSLFDECTPPYVLCYGKSYWESYKRIFPGQEFASILGGRLQVARERESLIVLTPFFAYYLMTVALIEDLVTALETFA